MLQTIKAIVLLLLGFLSPVEGQWGSLAKSPAALLDTGKGWVSGGSMGTPSEVRRGHE